MDHEITELFAEELNPVAAKAQRKVPVPEGLDLTAWINEPPREEDEAKVCVYIYIYMHVCVRALVFMPCLCDAPRAVK